MERRFDMTNFEESLREHADQFTMTPSKRTWNGIYNNLHPGSKWPSITVALVLLFTLVTVGHLNNTSREAPGKTTLITSQENKLAGKAEGVAVFENTTGIATAPAPNNTPPAAISSPIEGSTAQEIADLSLTMKKGDPSDKETSKMEDASIATVSLKQGAKTLNVQKNVPGLGTGVMAANRKMLINDPVGLRGNATIDNSIADFPAPELNAIARRGESKNLLKEQPLVLVDHSVVDNEKHLISNNNPSGENGAGVLSRGAAPLLFPENRTRQSGQKNSNAGINKEDKPAKNNPVAPHKKRNPKVNWIYFATPTISSVFFRGKPIQPLSTQNVSPVVMQQMQNKRNMLYNARPGYKVGTQMAFAFSQKWQFTSGAALSYSGYNIISNQVHPTFAYLMLRDERAGGVYPNSYITHYGNGQGLNQTMLSNKNWQLSLPVGLQYILWGNKNAQITLASSLEPSLVVKSNAFIISSDGRNYVSDPSLLRNFNVSGNFGSYITFSSRKIKWQIGPDVRYQILSTYKKNYPVREHLIDYGIRIGISK